MGWSEYLAAAGCVSTAVSYQLYQAKSTDYKSLSIELYKKIRDLEQKLEDEYQKGNGIIDEKKRVDEGPVLDVVKLDSTKFGSLQREEKRLDDRNQVLESEATILKQKNAELEGKVREYEAKINQLQLKLENVDVEKESLKELYQFRLNSEIERLITARDLEIANLSRTVKSFNDEQEKGKHLSEQLVKAERKILEKEKEISTLKTAESNSTQSRAQLNKTLDELQSNTKHYEEELKQMSDKTATDAKEISRLKDELNCSHEKLSKLSHDLEVLKGNISEKEREITEKEREITEKGKEITEKEREITEKDSEIVSLRSDIEEQKTLVEIKNDLLNNALRSQDDLGSKFKELGFEVEHLFNDVTIIEKITQGEVLRSSSTSEEFDIVDYNESKPSSEDFEELKMEDSEHSSTESTGKDLDQDKDLELLDNPASSGHSSVDSDESNPLDIGYIIIINKKIELIREHVKNVKAALILSTSTMQEKKSLLLKFIDILDVTYEASVIMAPDLAQKLEDKTKKIEKLDAKIKHLKESNSLCSELGNLQETRDLLDVQVMEARLENELLLKILNCLKHENEIKDLRAEMAHVSIKAQDYDRMKTDRAELENRVSEKEAEIDRLTKQLDSIVAATEKVGSLQAELSDKNKEISTLNNMLKLHQDNKQTTDSAQKQACSDDIGLAISENQASSPLSLKSHNKAPISGLVDIPTNVTSEDQSKSIASNQSLPELDTNVSNLSPHFSKPILEGKQGDTNKESHKPENLTTCPVSEENDFRTAESSYKLTIADLKRQLVDANLKIAKQHKVISKNLELLKESRSRSASPLPSPTKN